MLGGLMSAPLVSMRHEGSRVPGGGHLSGPAVAGGVVRPYPERSDGQPLSLSGLAPGGVYQAAMVAHGAGELLPHLFTLTRHPGPSATAPCEMRCPGAWALPSYPCGTKAPGCRAVSLSVALSFTSPWVAV